MRKHSERHDATEREKLRAYIGKVRLRMWMPIHISRCETCEYEYVSIKARGEGPRPRPLTPVNSPDRRMR